MRDVAADVEVTEVELELVGRGAWRVTWNGRVIVERSADPEYDAARALLALGITGEMRSRHAGSKHWALRIDIERAAALMCEGLRVVPFDRKTKQTA